MLRIVIVISTFLLLGHAAAAQDFYKELFVRIDKNKIELESNIVGGQFGADFTTGDFNGDGISDIAIGAPFSSISARNWSGAVSVFFGGDNLAANKITYFGENTGDQFGTVLESGDFNGDSIDDLVIGSYSAYSGDLRPGRVDIIYGMSTWGRRNGEFVNFKPDLTLFGEDTNDAFGIALSTIDINDDNIDDLFVGAPFNGKTGSVYTYFGNKEGLPDKANIKFLGFVNEERFGSSISSGDLNGDRSEELLIGAYYSSGNGLKQQGRVYVYKDVKAHKRTSDHADFILEGTTESGWFGFDLETGDLDGDGFEDVAISSFPYSGDRKAGNVSIFLGNAQRINTTPDVIISDPDGDMALGVELLIEDINNDRMDDLIIGAPGVGEPVSLEEGDVYILYGKNKFESSYSVAKDEMDVIIHGENFDDWFGYGLGAFDYNGDEFIDLIIGSRYSDMDSGIDNGKVFILPGSPDGFGTTKKTADQGSRLVNRAELVSEVLKKFDLKTKKADLIDQCHEYIEFCLFNFTIMSSFDGLQLKPLLILYPDIHPSTPYYEDVNLATMLGLINGYTDEDSPFKPDAPVSRIQALKVVLGAADLVPQKYKFELPDSLNKQISYFDDVNGKISHMWWYARYLNFAVEHKILEPNGLFRPDDAITIEELDEIINNTISFLNSRNEEIQP